MYPFPSRVDDGRDTEDTEMRRWLNLLINKGMNSHPGSPGSLDLGGRWEWDLWDLQTVFSICESPLLQAKGKTSRVKSPQSCDGAMTQFILGSLRFCVCTKEDMSLDAAALAHPTHGSLSPLP